MFLEKVRFLLCTDGLNIVTVAKDSIKYSVLSIPVCEGFLDQQLCLCFPILARFTQWKNPEQMARRNYTLSIWKPIFIQNWSWELKLVDDFFLGNKNLKAQISNRQDVLAKQTTQATLGFAERNAEGYGFVTEDGHESGKGPAEGSWEGGVWRGFGGFCVHVGTKDAYNFDFSWICWWMFFFSSPFFFGDRFFFCYKKWGEETSKNLRGGAVSCSAKICQIWVTRILKLTTDDWRTPSRSPLQIRDIVF